MLKFSRMSTHLGARAHLLRHSHLATDLFTSPFLRGTGVALRSAANERTLLAWLRTSAAFFSIGLAFAKIDQFQDDVVSVSFVSVGILTFIVGCIRYYQVKIVLETKDSNFQYALRIFPYKLVPAVPAHFHWLVSVQLTVGVARACAGRRKASSDWGRAKCSLQRSLLSVSRRRACSTSPFVRSAQAASTLREREVGRQTLPLPRQTHSCRCCSKF